MSCPLVELLFYGNILVSKRWVRVCLCVCVCACVFFKLMVRFRWLIIVVYSTTTKAQFTLYDLKLRFVFAYNGSWWGCCSRIGSTLPVSRVQPIDCGRMNRNRNQKKNTRCEGALNDLSLLIVSHREGLGLDVATALSGFTIIRNLSVSPSNS